MKVSEFLNSQNIPPFLLGAFYGRFELTSDNKFIYTYSSYKNWTIFKNTNLYLTSKYDFTKTANEISKPYSYWELNNKTFPRADISFGLENDLNLNRESFFNRLNRKILSSEFINAEPLTEDKRMFIRGFSELRASIDRNRNFLTMDYTKHNQQETKRVRILIDYLNVPVNIVNYNFREFQPDYTAGIKRETQLRYNLQWYATNIGFINNYRIEAFKANIYYTDIVIKNNVTYFICPQPLKSDNTEFENRLAYYTHNVFDKKLTKNDLIKFKKLIGSFDNEDKFKRDMSIVNYIRYYTEDKCDCCCDDYKIEDRTHIEPKTGRPHFEIHHMISLGHNKELDDVDNLSKICPACHAALGRGSADEKTQKTLIKKIFSHKPNILAFCKSYYDEEDFEQIVDLVWKDLK